MHKNISVIQRIYSSTSKVDSDKLEMLTRETSLIIAEKLLWVYL